MPEPIRPDPSITIPQPEPKSRLKAPAKLIAISVASILLGIGLCSVGGLNFEGDNAHPAIVAIGALAFWGGVVSFGIGVFWGLISLVSRP